MRANRRRPGCASVRWLPLFVAVGCSVLLLSGAAAAATGTPVATVSVGQDYACAVTTGGAAACWGDNSDAQLGDGTTNNSLTPVAVSGLSSGVSAISASYHVGEAHTCALMADGTAKCWGSNSEGELGDGTAASSKTPVAVAGLSDAVSITVGGFHTCALTSTGAAKCWGDNGAGQLGDGTTTARWAPVPVSGLSSGVAAIAAGFTHTCAVTSGGAAECWGANSDGELGDGTTTDSATPVPVDGLSSGVVAISAGAEHTCAVTAGGGVECWGDNHSGQLGDGTTTSSSVPVDVSGLSSGVVAVSAGGTRTCALTSAGEVECWGSDNGVGSTPTDVTGIVDVTDVSQGDGSTCAVATGSTGFCWGANDSGQLGDGTTQFFVVPVPFEIDFDLAIASAPDITSSATSDAGATVTFASPAATDGDGESPSVDCSPASGSVFPVGTTQVTCTASGADDTPSSVQTSFNVTVTDDDLALTGVPSDLTTLATGSNGAVVTYTPPATVDEDASGPTASCSPASGSTFPIGTTTVTCTATDTDDANSPAKASFSVNVKSWADVGVRISGPSSTRLGSTATYLITVADSGPGTASNVVMTAQVPFGTKFQSITTTQGSCKHPATGATSGTIACSLGDLAAGTNALQTVALKVALTGKGGIVILTASANSQATGATAATPDVNPANNTASIQTSASNK